jgi:proteic killer suppression protein
MIRNFRHRGLKDLFEAGRSRRVRPDLVPRVLRRLDALDHASQPEDMNIPGFNFHRLAGGEGARYTVHVNGPWCITFGWVDGEAVDVDLVNYH